MPKTYHLSMDEVLAFHGLSFEVAQPSPVTQSYVAKLEHLLGRQGTPSDSVTVNKAPSSGTTSATTASSLSASSHDSS
jgi:hypothetical protein